MSDAIARIKTAAILRVVGWAFQDYPCETTGIAFGDEWEGRYGHRFEVLDADRILTISQTPTNVISDDSSVRRFEAIVGESMGAFHSHPRYGRNKEKGRLALGKSDRHNLIEGDPYEIEIVIALNPAERWSPMALKDFTFSGCFEYRRRLYRASIGAYYAEPITDERNRPRRAQLSVPLRELRNYFI